MTGTQLATFIITHNLENSSVTPFSDFIGFRIYTGNSIYPFICYAINKVDNDIRNLNEDPSQYELQYCSLEYINGEKHNDEFVDIEKADAIHSETGDIGECKDGERILNIIKSNNLHDYRVVIIDNNINFIKPEMVITKYALSNNHNLSEVSHIHYIDSKE